MAQKFVGIVPHKTNDQSLNDLSTKIFTVGGIDVTTNLSSSAVNSGGTMTFSNSYTLDTLSNIPTVKTTFSDLNDEVILSYDPRNIKYYAKYGSALELLRVSLEEINLGFPGVILSEKDAFGREGSNVISSRYDVLEDQTTFVASTNYFSNPYSLYYLDNLQYSFNDDRINSIRNLTLNYLKYEIEVNGVAYPIVDFIPTNTNQNSNVTFTVRGKPFENGNLFEPFYIKPQNQYYVDFLSTLDDFSKYIYSPNTNGISIFNDYKLVDGGIKIFYQLKFKFPKIDKYNLDFFTSKYETFKEDIYEYSKKYDEVYSNILSRKLIPNNIQSITLEDANSEYPIYDEMNRVFVVWGRELDVINRRIENVKFFNSVTYNKRDNLPEAYIPAHANLLGWEVDVLDELDYDKWRQLVINSPHLFKSKGTKSAIEFLFEFSGIDRRFFDLNTYVLRAKKPIDINTLERYYNLLGGDFDISELPIDSEGYPTFSPNTRNDYFQMIGEADNGLSYFYKYMNLLPDFVTGSSVTYTGESVELNNLYSKSLDYTGGTISYRVVNDDFVDNECFEVSGDTIIDPYPTPILDICDCELPLSDLVQNIKVCPVEFTGCTNIIMDIFYECNNLGDAETTINVYGGTPPYTLYGLTGDTPNFDSQYVADFPSGETYELYVVDVDGCSSNTYNYQPLCLDPCLGTNIQVDFSYDCIKDEFGENTGEAIVNLTYSGGTEPYTIIGVNSGDTVNHGEIITTEVIDFGGCTSGQLGLKVSCKPPDVVNCDPINLELTLETTSVQLDDKTSNVNATYSIEGLPSGLYIDEVNLTSTNSNIVGNPVTTTFNTINGADTLTLNFDPIDTPESVSVVLTIEIILTNGCTYNDTTTLTVDPRQLGNAEIYNNINLT